MSASKPPVACPVCRSRLIVFFQSVDQQRYWRCERCQATFLEPGQRLSPEQEKAHYDLHQNRMDDPGYRSFLNRLATPLLKRLSPGQHGLDYGSGPGPLLARILTEAGYPTTCWDPLYCAHEDRLNQHYDFITLSEVAEHLYDPAGTFERIVAMIRPGGWLAIMTTFQTEDDRFAGWHYRRDPTHVVFYRTQTMRWLAKQYECSLHLPARNVALLQLKPVRSGRRSG